LSTPLIAGRASPIWPNDSDEDRPRQDTAGEMSDLVRRDQIAQRLSDEPGFQTLAFRTQCLSIYPSATARCAGDSANGFLACHAERTEASRMCGNETLR